MAIIGDLKVVLGADTTNTGELVDALGSIKDAGASTQEALQALLDKLAKYQTGLAEATASTRLIQTQMTALSPPVQRAKEDVDAFNTRLEAWTKAQAALRVELSAAIAIQDKYRVSIADTNKQLNAQVNSVNQARVAQEKASAALQTEATPGLKALLSATNDSASGFTALTDSIDATSNSIFNIGKRLIIRQLLMNLATGILETAGAFNDAEAQITASVGAIGEALTAYDEGLRTLASTAGVSSLDVGKAMGAVAVAFDLQPGDELTAVSKQVLDLARITGESAVKIAQDTAKLAHAYDIDPGALDSLELRLLTVVQTSGVAFSDLEKDLTKFKGLFEGLKIPIENAAQAIGDMQKAGLEVPQVLAAMQSEMNKLSKDGATNLADAMSQLFTRIHDAGTAAEAFEISAKTFGTGATGMVELIRSGRLDFEQFYATLRSLKPTIEDQADSMRTLKESWQDMKNELANHQLGESVTEIAVFFVDLAKGVAKAINDMMQWNDRLTESISATGAFARELLNLSTRIPILGAPIQNIIDLWVKAGKALDFYVSKYNLSYGTYWGGSGMSDPGAGKTTSGAKDMSGPSTLPVELQAPGDAAKEATPSESKADKNAIDLQLYGKEPTKSKGGDPEYKALKQEVDALMRRVDAKNNIDFLNLEKAIYTQILKAPTETDQINRQALALAEQIKINTKLNRPSTDAQYDTSASLKTSQSLAGMDQAHAEKLLGLPDPAEITGKIQEITAAFKYLQDQGTQTPGFIALAWDHAQAKILADTRSIGGSVSDAMVLTADWAKTAERVTNMDLGLARQELGLTTIDEALQKVVVNNAAYAKILASVADGTSTATDATNAQIDVLTKNKAALASVGKAFDDVSQTQLNYLNTQKQINSLNSSGALALFGLKSAEELDNGVAKLQAAYQKIKDERASALAQNAVSESVSNATGGAVSLPMATVIPEVQEVTAHYELLRAEIAKLGQTNGTVTASMIAQLEGLKAKAVDSASTLASSLVALGVTTTNSANLAIDSVYKQLATVGAAYGKSSEEYTAAALKAYTEITGLLQKSGQAVPAEITKQLDMMKAKVIDTTMTIDQAYAALGLKTRAEIEGNAAHLGAALGQMSDDETSTYVANFIAQANASAKYYDDMLKSGQDFSAKDKALSDVRLEQANSYANNTENAWSNAMKGVAHVWDTVLTDFSSGITGLINGTESVSKAFLKMGQDIEAIFVKYILKNLLFTDSNLHKLQEGILGLLGAKATNTAETAITNKAIDLGTAPVLNAAVPALSQGTDAAINGTGSLTGAGAGGTFMAQMDAASAKWVAAVDTAAATFTDAVVSDGADFTAATSTASTELATGTTTASTALSTALDTSGAALEAALTAGTAELDGGAAAAATQLTGGGTAAATQITTAAAVHAVAVDTAAADHGVTVALAAADHGVTVAGAAATHASAVTGAAFIHGIAVKVAAAGHSIAVGAAAIGHGIAIAAAAVWHAVTVTTAAIGHGIAVSAAATWHALSVTGAAIYHGVAVAAAAVAHGISVGIAAIFHGAAVTTGAIFHGIAVGGAALAHGIAVLGAAILHAFGIGTAATVHAAIVTTGAGIAAAELIAGGAAAGALSGGLGSILGSVIGGVSSLIGSVVGLVQGAHQNSLLDKIEKSTRFTWVATGEASDSISHTNQIIAAKITSMLDFMNGDLRQYLQNMNVDLDTIAGHGSIALNLDTGGIVSILADIFNEMVTVAGTDAEILTAIQAIQIVDSGASAAVNKRSMSERSSNGGSESGSVAVTDSNVSKVTASHFEALTSSMQLTGNAFSDLVSKATGPQKSDATGYNRFLVPTTPGTPIPFGPTATTTTATIVPDPGPIVDDPNTTSSSGFGTQLTPDQIKGKAPVTKDQIYSSIQYGLTHPNQISTDKANDADTSPGQVANLFGKLDLRGTNLGDTGAKIHTGQPGQSDTNAGQDFNGLNAEVLDRRYGLSLNASQFDTMVAPAAGDILNKILKEMVPQGQTFDSLQGSDKQAIASAFSSALSNWIEGTFLPSISKSNPELLKPLTSAQLGADQNATNPWRGSNDQVLLATLRQENADKAGQQAVIGLSSTNGNQFVAPPTVDPNRTVAGAGNTFTGGLAHDGKIGNAITDLAILQSLGLASNALTAWRGASEAARLAANAATAAANANTAYQGGVANKVDPNSYTGRYLASQKPGYALTLPASVMDAGSSRAIDYNSLATLGGNPNAYTQGNLINPVKSNVQVNINGSTFPVGMTPNQVGEALATQLRTQTALLR